MFRKGISHILLASTALSCASIGLADQSFAGPEDGTITAGAATITQSGLNTNIHQSSDRAIIDWRSFDVNADETVRFYQPGSTSITLNRINDSKASLIDGRVEANGRIMLLNQNGIVFGAGSRIDVAGLVAATGNIDDNAFMSGSMSIGMTPGHNSTAKIINNGHISARDAGLIGLVAPTVENNGIIEARLGKVTLAGAERMTLDLAGDNLISLDVDDEFNGKVINKGSITADGGTIVLTASRARDAVENSIINTGTLRANTVNTQNGRIILSAGGTRKNQPARAQTTTIAAVKNAGTITASSGKIELTGDSIELTAASVIDASATNGGNGGTIHIGGSYQGADDRPSSEWVEVAQGSRTKSNGDIDGDGGTIIFWANRQMSYRGETEAEGGAQSGDGGFVEVSGKNHLIFDGRVSTLAPNGKDGTLLLDPTNITISAGGNSSVTGTSPYTPTADDVTSVLNITTLQNALALGNVIVQTRATGAQAGDITVATAIAWTSGNTLTLDAHNNIIVNNAINANTGNLTLIAGNDVQLNAALSGSGTLTLMPGADNVAVGIGASSVGAFNISATDFSRFTNGWGNIVIGRTTATAAMDVRALTWLDNLTLQSGSGAINVNGIITMGTNDLTIVTDGDVALNIANALTGSGNFALRQSSAATTIGLGDGQAGTINFTTTEMGRIRNGWASLTFGRTDGTGAVNIGALTFNDFLTVESGSGVINVNGTMAMTTNTLTFRTDGNLNLAVANALTGTVALTIVQASAGTSIGLGDGQAGTLHLSNAEIANIADGWSSITIGRTDGSADMNIGALSWTDPLVLQTGSGAINFNGSQSMAANNLTVRTDVSPYLAPTANLTGTGTFALVQSSNNVSMGVGTGEVGDIQIDTGTLSRIMGTWASLVFGRTDGTAELNVADGLAFNDPTTFRTGTGQLNINGGLSMGNNTLNLQTSSDLYIGGNLSGTGSSANLTITVTIPSTSIGIGDGQTGTLSLSNAELARFVNGWNSITIGAITQTGAMNVGARTWQDHLTLRTGTGLMTINGTQTLGGNNLTLTTDSNLVLNAALTGTGTLTIQPGAAATTMGIGTGQAGDISLTDAKLNQITDGWTSVVLGSSAATGLMNVAARTWYDNTTLRTGTGALNINGIQTMGANNLTLTTSSNLAVNAALTGTGVLSFTGAANATTIGVGTGQAGTLSLSDAELNLITDGWTTIVFGSTAMTGALNIGGRTWTDSIDIRTNSGALNINGAQNMGTNNLTIRTNTNLTIGQILAGTGNITILGSSAGTSMGIGTGQLGTLSLTDAELAFISDGWNNRIFGSTSMTGAMNVGALTWTDNLILRTAGGIMNMNGAQTMGSNNLTLQSNADISIGANLTGTGTITIANSTAATNIGIGVGTGQTGSLSLSDIELGRIVDGWSNIIIGSNIQTGVMNVGARTWTDNLTLITSTGLMSILGAQNMGTNNLTLQTSSGLTINANLIGSGQLVIQPNANNTSIAVGSTQSGTLFLSDSELSQIVDGWAGITIGSATGTGAMGVGTRTWNDNLTLRSATGQLTINGIQTMGANNLTLQTDSNLALNANLVGTGNLTIRGNSLPTTMGIGDTQAGTLNLTNLELSRIVDGWNSVTMGRTDSFGHVNIGGYTWVNPMTFVTGGNVILNGVQSTTETTGTTLVFATINGSFINNAGASAINPGSGRYLVYSVAEANDTLGGLIRPTILSDETYAGYGPALVTETGNVYLYSGLVSKTLYLIIDDADKVYGSNVPVFTYTYIGGLQNGDLLSDVIASYTMTAIGSTVLDDAGVTRTITGNFNTNLGYSVIVTNGTMTVVKADLIATVDNESRIYGDANPTFTFSYSGFVNGDNETDLDTDPTASTTANALSNVGTYAITAAGGNDNNYNIILENGTLTIGKATLNATVQSATKVYGDTNPGFNIVYTGFRNGDTVGMIDTQGTVTTTANALSNVGTYALTGGGAFDNNYTFSYTNSNMTVTRATLTATADNQTRVYGDTNPALTISYSGFRNGDTASVLDTGVSISTAAGATTNVGNHAITLSGGVDNNYTVNLVNGTLGITKSMLTVTADNQTKVYGDNNPALTYTYSGFKNGESSGVIDVNATAATTANLTTGVGNHAITVSGASDNNYDFTYVNGTLAITPATLTVTADNQSREYGLTNPALTASYSGFRNGDTVATLGSAPTLSTTATILSDVNTYAITASGGTAANYVFSYVAGTLDITKAMLTATADSHSRVYGDANPALTTSYTGFRNGDTASVLNTGATATTTATAASNVDTYVITTSGAFDNNYDFTYVNGALEITKANLTITADDKVRIYGDNNPAFTVTYSGFRNGDTEADINGYPSISTAANAFTDVGTYDIVLAGGTDNNYNLILNDGTLTIDKATLTVNIDSDTRVYGDSNAPLTFSYSGFRNSDTAVMINTAPTLSTIANEFSDVGSYAITASGGDDNNYTFAYVNGTLNVTPATLTVTINDATREYGLTNPAFSASYSGFRNGDTASVLNVGPVFSTVAVANSDIGNYAITATGSDNNYSLNFVNGNLEITRAALTLQANDQIRLYGDPNPPLTYTAIGLRAGDTTSVLSGVTLSTTANATTPLGSYAINIGGGSATNYTLSYLAGNIDIVGEMPAPPVTTPPVTTLPPAATQPLTTPGGYTASSTLSSYNVPLQYIFATNPSLPGRELMEGTGSELNGYIVIYYYKDSITGHAHGEPLVMIEPSLYFFDEEQMYN